MMSVVLFKMSVGAHFQNKGRLCFFLIKIEHFIKVGDFLRSKSLIFERLKRIFMVVVKLLLITVDPSRKPLPTPHSKIKIRHTFPISTYLFKIMVTFLINPFSQKIKIFTIVLFINQGHSFRRLCT